MTDVRRVAAHELGLARDLHNRFTAQDRSTATVRSWYGAVPGLFLFAVEDGAVVGVCTARPRGERAVSLAGIGVEPDRRGEGVGSRLLDRFEDEALAAGVERISVASAGGRVDGFYLDAGFDPERILVMDPDGGPEAHADADFDATWDRNDDGSRKCYVEVTGHDPAVLEAVREAFGDDGAVYVMTKELDGR